MSNPSPLRWAELLAEAVNSPGRILEAYRMFPGYSLGNRLAATFQCLGRHIPLGPIGTLKKWNALGRTVRKGETALLLCMPVTVKARADADTDEAGDAHGPARTKTIFVWKPRWFVLAQTDGPPLDDAVTVPSWDEERALATLGVTRVPFTHTDGNVQGYAEGRTVAVSPLAQLPAKTLFHELGHVLMAHTAERGADHPDLPKTLTEAEAEAVALLCLEALGLPGAEYARGYIQSWYGAGTPLPESSATKIFRSADTILRAGQLPEATAPEAA